MKIVLIIILSIIICIISALIIIIGSSIKKKHIIAKNKFNKLSKDFDKLNKQEKAEFNLLMQELAKYDRLSIISFIIPTIYFILLLALITVECIVI